MDSAEAGIPEELLNGLDLSQIKWKGPVWARTAGDDQSDLQFVS